MTQRDGNTLTLTVKGELDANTVPEIRSELDAIVEQSPQAVVVELSGLRLIDSTGVGALVSLFKRIGANGGKFTITGVQGQPYSIFQVLRLDRVFGLGG